MTKIENLTADEKAKLINFIGEAVLNNSLFPSLKFGNDKVTIQELLNSYTVKTLVELGSTLRDKMNKNSANEFQTGYHKLRFGGFDGETVIEAIKLMIKRKEYELWKAEALDRKKELKTKLEEAKSPEEKKKEWEEEYQKIEELTKEV